MINQINNCFGFISTSRNTNAPTSNLLFGITIHLPIHQYTYTYRNIRFRSPTVPWTDRDRSRPDRLSPHAGLPRWTEIREFHWFRCLIPCLTINLYKWWLFYFHDPESLVSPFIPLLHQTNETSICLPHPSTKICSFFSKSRMCISLNLFWASLISNTPETPINHPSLGLTIFWNALAMVVLPALVQPQIASTRASPIVEWSQEEGRLVKVGSTVLYHSQLHNLRFHCSL